MGSGGDVTDPELDQVLSNERTKVLLKSIENLAIHARTTTLALNVACAFVSLGAISILDSAEELERARVRYAADTLDRDYLNVALALAESTADGRSGHDPSVALQELVDNFVRRLTASVPISVGPSKTLVGNREFLEVRYPMELKGPSSEEEWAARMTPFLHCGSFGTCGLLPVVNENSRISVKLVGRNVHFGWWVLAARAVQQRRLMDWNLLPEVVIARDHLPQYPIHEEALRWESFGLAEARSDYEELRKKVAGGYTAATPELELPLVATKVRQDQFLVYAPWALATVFTYLHIYLWILNLRISDLRQLSPTAKWGTFVYPWLGLQTWFTRERWIRFAADLLLRWTAFSSLAWIACVGFVRHSQSPIAMASPLVALVLIGLVAVVVRRGRLSAT
jgi:hypothetical protein